MKLSGGINTRELLSFKQEGENTMNANRLEKAIKAAKEDRKNARIAKAHITQWEYSSNYQLEDVYKTYSVFKARAWKYCIDLMSDLNGWCPKVLSANSQAFTVGFEFSDPETGEAMFAYITKDYNRFCYQV